MILSSTIASAQQSRQVQASRVATQRGQIYTQTAEVGFILVGSASETVTEISFVNTFLEKPTFTFGFELGPNQHVTAGSFPTLSAFILQWVNPNSSTPYPTYTGARVGIVASGVDGQILVAHLSFMARGLGYPAGAAPTNGTGSA